MDKNIKILVVNNTDLPSILASIGYHNVTSVVSGKAALSEFVHAKNPAYAMTIIDELSDQGEEELLQSIIEIDPHQYVIMLSSNLSADKVLNFVRHGSQGMLTKPLTTKKIQTELDKYSFLAGEERKSVAG